MRFFRLLAITVLLVACVVLGSACTGAQGEQGPQGDVGATGTTGPAGPAGADGAQGPQGLQGIQGERGEKGDPGLPGVGVEWKGEWSNAATYSLNDAVGYQGSSYVSKQDANTNHVPMETAWWDLWVQKGDTGATGAPGADGEDGQDGAPGPNMIVAMGNIASDGTINQGYNVTSCVVTELPDYEITLTGISWDQDSYVTLVTTAGLSDLTAIYHGYGDKLMVTIFAGQDVAITNGFSFMVLQCP